MAMHRVPQHFSTIQAALDQASPGDVVYLAPGLYVENLTLRVPVSLLAAPGTAAVQGAGESPTLLCETQSGAVTLFGLVIRHSPHVAETAYGIHVNSGVVSAELCDISSEASEAVHVQGPRSDLVLSECKVSEESPQQTPPVPPQGMSPTWSNLLQGPHPELDWLPSAENTSMTEILQSVPPRITPQVLTYCNHIPYTHQNTQKNEKKPRKRKRPRELNTNLKPEQPHTYHPARATTGLGEVFEYCCNYCGFHKMSSSLSTDGAVRIRCPCGGQQADGKQRMHAKWDRIRDGLEDKQV